MASPHRGDFLRFLRFLRFRPSPPRPAGSEALPAGSEALLAGSGQRKTRKMEKIPLCGDAIGHRPLRGRCPLTTKLTEKLTSKKLIRGHREPLTM